MCRALITDKGNKRPLIRNLRKDYMKIHFLACGFARVLLHIPLVWEDNLDGSTVLPSQMVGMRPLIDVSRTWSFYLNLFSPPSHLHLMTSLWCFNSQVECTDSVCFPSPSARCLTVHHSLHSHLLKEQNSIIFSQAHLCVYILREWPYLNMTNSCH